MPPKTDGGYTPPKTDDGYTPPNTDDGYNGSASGSYGGSSGGSSSYSETTTTTTNSSGGSYSGSSGSSYGSGGYQTPQPDTYKPQDYQPKTPGVCLLCQREAGHACAISVCCSPAYTARSGARTGGGMGPSGLPVICSAASKREAGTGQCFVNRIEHLQPI